MSAANRHQVGLARLHAKAVNACYSRLDFLRSVQFSACAVNEALYVLVVCSEAPENSSLFIALKFSSCQRANHCLSNSDEYNVHERIAMSSTIFITRKSSLEVALTTFAQRARHIGLPFRPVTMNSDV